MQDTYHGSYHVEAQVSTPIACPPTAYATVSVLGQPDSDPSQSQAFSTPSLDETSSTMIAPRPVRACRSSSTASNSKPSRPNVKKIASPRKLRSAGQLPAKASQLSSQKPSKVARAKVAKRCRSDDDEEWSPASTRASRRRKLNAGSPELTTKIDKPFHCPLNCGETFIRSSDAQRHIETAACELVPKEQSVTAVRCEGCNGIFSRMDSYKRHRENTCGKKDKI